MISCVAVGRRGQFSLKSAGALSVIVFAGLAIGGCSADVTRFDSTSFSFNDPPPVPSEPVRTSALNDGSTVSRSSPRGPYGAGASSVEVAALPEPEGAGSQSYSYPSYSPSRSAPSVAPERAPSYEPRPFGAPRRDGYSASTPPAARPSVASGRTIDVQPGDTLYGLSRRHGVSVAALMQANSLSSPNLRPGQKLQLPTDSETPSRSSVAAAKAVESARPAPVPLAEASAETVSRYGGTYTVKQGDSLYAVARAHNVKFAELQEVNGITDPRRVKPGTVLRVPGRASAEPTHMAAAAPVAAPSASPPAFQNRDRSTERAASPIVPPIAAETDSSTSMSSAAPGTTTRPTIINSEQRVAALTENKANDASPEPQHSAPRVEAPVAAAPAPKEEKVALAAPTGTAVVDGVKLRWPTTGRIIAGFGGRPDGTHNDGINLSVPLGTEIHAAESGVVAYAGSELKGYGNLVLLRHDNGWVTAYAHNDEMLVKHGDKVKRGQVISRAGKTGSVDQPQIHFELRQGSKPVDPLPYLERL
ncbi:peptidase M23 [Hyphomicrobium methylovorum]|uniref:LysM peptidoglycan-binding domain-containing protein n=1 Tax=Hyphomicrobium methylovorum TaxID=84 RepID=UPI0015E74EFD|nr:LysM peptidoglycan-binding domain-containing protein [Hyphomicrobium methylovorum]MBA2127539.1 peptidase M23 [Hyphomicrobium methylovorum]